MIANAEVWILRDAHGRFVFEIGIPDDDEPPALQPLATSFKSYRTFDEARQAVYDALDIEQVKDEGQWRPVIHTPGGFDDPHGLRNPREYTSAK